MSMIDGEKLYIGTVDSMFAAAILYDIVSIQSKCLKSKTNFMYRKHELLTILKLTKIVPIKENMEFNELKKG